ncbi:MAG: DUF4350 domain-containing protein [Acidobacteria bacterium]|nr:DUF4350 domain-containing protein [Acidobacteriota bacterium]
MAPRLRCFCLGAFTLSLCVLARAQQVPDTAFKPAIAQPAYVEGKGPVVLLDEAHFNFHTATGRYLAFAELLRRDGYVVKSNSEKFTAATLQAGKILVIANALHESNQDNWSPPNPSAFTDAEIAAVQAWVKGGGALLLIADHLPFPGAADKLATAFGIRFNNGYASDPRSKNGPLVFKTDDQSLLSHPITKGRAAGEQVTSVATFTGSAFQIEKGGRPLMVFGKGSQSFMVRTFGEKISDETPRVAIDGWWQGATLRYGKGRVAVFGEAAMFSAQLAGAARNPMGMNAPMAAQNPQFLLNTLHWLAGLLGE